jgi:hypothetical protein
VKITCRLTRRVLPKASSTSRPVSLTIAVTLTTGGLPIWSRPHRNGETAVRVLGRSGSGNRVQVLPAA